MVFYRVLIACIVITIWNILVGAINLDVPLAYWLALFVGALLGPTISIRFMFKSYQYWELSKTSLIVLSQPLFALPLAYFFLGNLPEKHELIGGIIIMIGAIWLGLMQLRLGQPGELPGNVSLDEK